MESKLVDRIVRKIPSWQDDFKLSEWQKKRNPRIWMPMYSEIKQEIEQSAIPKYRNLFVELAREPIGFYTYMRASPGGEYNESSVVWYEKEFFEIENFSCAENPYHECDFHISPRVEICHCPAECNSRNEGIFISSLCDSWMRIELIRFCLDSYSLKSEERRDLEDNLNVFERCKATSVKPFGEEPRSSTIYDSTRALIEGKSQEGLFGIEYYFPRIAKKIVELRGR